MGIKPHPTTDCAGRTIGVYGWCGMVRLVKIDPGAIAGREWLLWRRLWRLIPSGNLLNGTRRAVVPSHIRQNPL